MKQFFLVCALVVSASSFGQDDHFNFNMGFSLNLIPVTLQGPHEIVSSSTVIGNTIVPSESEYKYEKRQTGFGGSTISLGFHIPCYKSENWTAGLNLNVGFGVLKGITEMDDYTSILFDFPQFVYIRKQFKTKDLSFFLGYKRCLMSLSYGTSLAGIEMHFGEKNSFRIYASPYRSRYYIQYSNGDLIPALKIGELAFSFVHGFGK